MRGRRSAPGARRATKLGDGRLRENKADVPVCDSTEETAVQEGQRSAASLFAATDQIVSSFLGRIAVGAEQVHMVFLSFSEHSHKSVHRRQTPERCRPGKGPSTWLVRACERACFIREQTNVDSEACIQSYVRIELQIQPEWTQRLESGHRALISG